MVWLRGCAMAGFHHLALVEQDKHKVTLSQWYGGIVYGVVESCQLEDKFDFDWQTWWQKKQSILDPVTCLRLFIEEVLLEKIQQSIVIFVDEIDVVQSV